MDKKKEQTKEKRRNNEKRKEKSRDAARCRRNKESAIFDSLAECLPFAKEQFPQMDKASVVRLAISYIKVQDLVRMSNNKSVTSTFDQQNFANQPDEALFLQALDGFLLALSTDGDVIYVSDNVSEYLGLSQFDLMGQNIFEYSHPCDHDEIKDLFSSKTNNESQQTRNFFIRLKCTLTCKGRSVNIKSASYKVIHFVGHVVEDENVDGEKKQSKKRLIAVGQVIPHPSNIESPLPQKTFITKHGLDMKYTHADDRIMTEILGYTSEDLVGKSVYEFHHVIDSDAVNSSYKCLFAKGQCETSMYRFVAKHGGYVWVVTQGTVINDKLNKPQSVVCVNYIVSGVECQDEIYSAHQIPLLKSVEKECNNNIYTEISSEVKESVIEEIENQPVLINDQSLGLTSLDSDEGVKQEKAGAPRHVLNCMNSKTEEMNKGFLTFSEEEPGITLMKEEPDDLTHLAPMICYDACEPLNENPLEETPLLSNELLDDLLFRETFILEEDPDPYLSYRDQCSLSPQLLSPNYTQSPENSSVSLNSPGGSLGDEDHMSTFMSIQMDDDLDQSIKSSYITDMSIDTNLSLLMSNDLMWNGSEKSAVDIPDSNSSLAQLLCQSVDKHTIKTGDGGGPVSMEGIQNSAYTDKDNTNSWSSSKCTAQLSSHSRPNTNSMKRTINNSTCNTSSTKRIKLEPKERMSSELLAQLISNNHNRQSPKGKGNWLLNAGRNKAACISQPSDSVLMNLLVTPESPPTTTTASAASPGPPIYLQVIVDAKQLLALQAQATQKRTSSPPTQQPTQKRARIHSTPPQPIRKNSLLDPSPIPWLASLTQQDYEVNAPASPKLLQGSDLIKALDSASSSI